MVQNQKIEFVVISKPEEANQTVARRTVRAHVAERQHELRRQNNVFRNTTVHHMSELRLKNPRRTSHSARSSKEGGQSESTTEESSPVPRDTSQTNFQTFVLQDGEGVVGQCVKQLGTDLNAILDKFLWISDYHTPQFLRFHQHSTGEQISLREQVYPLLFVEPSLMTVGLLTAASYIVHEQGRNPATDLALLRLRSFALQQMQSILYGSPRHAADDHFICAIALSVKYEALYGSLKSYEAHVQGLLHIVRLRGGLAELGINGIVKTLVVWLDTVSAEIMGTSPRFEHSVAPKPWASSLSVTALDSSERPVAE